MRVILTLLTLSLTQSLFASFENDLPSNGDFRPNAEVYSIYITELDVNKLFMEVSNPYTNTIKCRGRVEYTVVEGFSTKIVKVADIYDTPVFPDNAFDRPSLIPVPLELDNDQRLMYNYRGEATLYCRGGYDREPLPRAFCEQESRLDFHQQMCETLYEGQTLYPLQEGHSFLGNCKCYN